MRRRILAAAVLAVALAAGGAILRSVAVSGIRDLIDDLPARVEGVRSVAFGDLDVSLLSGRVRVRDLRVVEDAPGRGERITVCRELELSAPARVLLAAAPPLRGLLLPADGRVVLGDLRARDLAAKETPGGETALLRGAEASGISADARVLADLLEGRRVDDLDLVSALGAERGEGERLSLSSGRTRMTTTVDRIVTTGVRGCAFDDMRAVNVKHSSDDGEAIRVAAIRASGFSPDRETALLLARASDDDVDALLDRLGRALAGGGAPVALMELEQLFVLGKEGERFGARRLALRRPPGGGVEALLDNVCLRADLLEEQGVVVRGLSRVCLDGRAEHRREGARMLERGDLTARDVGSLRWEIDASIPGGALDFSNPLTLIGATLNGLHVRYEDRGGLARLAFSLPFPESLPLMIRQELGDLLPGPANAPLVRALGDFAERPGVLEAGRRGSGAITALHLLNAGGVGALLDVAVTPGSETLADAVARLRREER